MDYLIDPVPNLYEKHFLSSQVNFIKININLPVYVSFLSIMICDSSSCTIEFIIRSLAEILHFINRMIKIKK